MVIRVFLLTVSIIRIVFQIFRDVSQIFVQIEYTWLELCYQINLLIIFSDGDVVIVRDSVDGLMFSLEQDSVFLEGGTIRNIFLLGLLIAMFSFEYQIIVES